MTTRNLVGAAAMKAVSNIDREELERQVSQCSGFVKMMCGVANNCAIQIVNMCRSKIEDIRDEDSYKERPKRPHPGYKHRANSIAEDACCQPVKTHEEVMREQALMDSMSKNPTEWFAHNTGFGLGFAVAAMMFADGEKMKRQMQEMEEERPYLEEINRIDAQFDNEIIRMSGFKW